MVGRGRAWVARSALAALLMLGACGEAGRGAGACEVGEAGCSCYDNRTCNAGLTCDGELCVAEASVKPASGGASSGGSGGASSGGGGGSTAGGRSAETSSTTSPNSTTGNVSGGTTLAATAGASTSTSSGNNAGGSAGSGGNSGAGGQAGSGTAGCPDVSTDGCSLPMHDFVHLYLMLDSSTSMLDSEFAGVTRWELVTGGIEQFVSQTDQLRVALGLQFFAWLNDDESCNTDNYATPEVSIGPLASVQDDIIAALTQHTPGGLTPTHAALAGAVQHAKAWAEEHPADATVVVFVTDGYPTRCEPMDIPAIAELASASYAQAPSVPVHVLGIDGTYNLDTIAQAGGTQAALRLANDGDTATVQEALNEIVDQHLTEQ